MSRISQFLNFNPADTSIYDDTGIGEIKVFPAGKQFDTLIDSNNYVRAGSVLSQSEYPQLYSIIGLINSGALTPKNIYINDVIRRFDPIVGANVFYGSSGTSILKLSANGYFGEVIATLPFSVTRDGENRDSFKYSTEAGYFLAAGNLGNLGRSTDGITWQIASNTETQTFDTFSSLTYGNGLYVAVGQGQLFRQSTNFITWDYFPNVTANNTAPIYASTYGNGVYVEGGLGGFIQTSTDGRSWTPRTSGTTSDINGLTYGNGVFVYIGNGGVLGTSTNGVAWTTRNSNTTSNIRAIVYGNSRWVWCGNTGALGYATSSTSWSTASSGTTTNLTAITYGNGLFLAAGIAATTLTSTNGVSWTLRLNSTAGTYVGSTEYLSPGTYSWIAPANVTSVSVVAVGGGGGGSYDIDQNGTYGWNGASSGAGGGLGWKNNIAVTPGQSYNVTVGSGGSTSYNYIGQSGTYPYVNSLGGNSFFISVDTVAGFGARDWGGSGNQPSTQGGPFFGDGGGQGGEGEYNTWPVSVGLYYNVYNYSGGGAGGYSGQGGRGVAYHYANNNLVWGGSWYGQPDTNSGAGSGGGSPGARGGGVGIWGKGVDGNSAAGFGGSGGDTQGYFGGGAGIGSTGQTGAVRIIWGPDRSFPQTATGNLATVSAGGDPAISLSYGNGLFVYNSELGRYLTSTDGITWVARNNPSTVTIRSSTYGNGKYFYADDLGAIYYNNNLSNSSNWIRSSNSTVDKIHTMTYNNGTYIFAGANTTQNGKSLVTSNGFVGLNIKGFNTINYHTAFYDPLFNTFAIGGSFQGGTWNSPSQQEDPWISNFRYSTDGYSWLPNVDLFKYYGAADRSTYLTKIRSITSVVFNPTFPSNNRTIVIVGEASTHGSLLLISNTTNQTFSGGFRAYSNSEIGTANGLYRIKETWTSVQRTDTATSKTVYALGEGNYIAQGSLSQWGGGNYSSGTRAFHNFDVSDVEDLDDTGNGRLIFGGGSWSGQLFTSNNISGIEYSGQYNIQNQFMVPHVTQAYRFESFYPTVVSYAFGTSQPSNNYINTANTFYENVYIRAK